MEVQEFVKQQIQRVEAELDVLRSKKGKAPPKKQKDRLAYLSTRVTSLRKIRDKNEELMNNLDVLEVREVKKIKAALG